jgi:hypothetical protein
MLLHVILVIIVLALLLYCRTEHYLINYNNKVLATAGDSNENNASVLEWNARNENGQKWVLQPDNTIRNAHGKCLGVSNDSNVTGARIVSKDCNLNENGQQWFKLNPTMSQLSGRRNTAYSLFNKHGKCLEIMNTNASQNGCRNANGQMWEIDQSSFNTLPNYVIKDLPVFENPINNLERPIPQNTNTSQSRSVDDLPPIETDNPALAILAAGGRGITSLILGRS